MLQLAITLQCRGTARNPLEEVNYDTAFELVEPVAESLFRLAADTLSVGSVEEIVGIVNTSSEQQDYIVYIGLEVCIYR